MVQPIIVEFWLWCARCGMDIVGHPPRVGRIDIEPCPVCLNEAMKAGYDKAMQEIFDTAKERG